MERIIPWHEKGTLSKRQSGVLIHRHTHRACAHMKRIASPQSDCGHRTVAAGCSLPMDVSHMLVPHAQRYHRCFVRSMCMHRIEAYAAGYPLIAPSPTLLTDWHVHNSIVAHHTAENRCPEPQPGSTIGKLVIEARQRRTQRIWPDDYPHRHIDEKTDRPTHRLTESRLTKRLPACPTDTTRVSDRPTDFLNVSFLFNQPWHGLTELQFKYPYTSSYVAPTGCCRACMLSNSTLPSTKPTRTT